MESFHHKFAEISQSHAGSLLRHKRLGSLGNVKARESLIPPPKRDDSSVFASLPLFQRTAVIQKDDKGYGLTVSGDNPVYVASTKPGGAADKVGVQVGDKIIKINGEHVMNSNSTDVMKLINASSYVVLTLLGKPANASTMHGELVLEHEPSSSLRELSSMGIFREGLLSSESVTAPQPVDAEKEKEVLCHKTNKIIAIYKQVLDECEALRKKSRSSEKILAQLQDKERTLKTVEAQLRDLPIQNLPPSVKDFLESQTPSINIDNDSVTLDTSGLPKKQRKPIKHSSSPALMYHPSAIEPQQRGAANVYRSKSDVSTHKNVLSECTFGSQGYKRTASNPETTSILPTVSDIASDSTRTSRSTSPTPLHSQILKRDSITADSGIEDGSQSSTVVCQQKIIGMEDDEFLSEDENTGDSKAFNSLQNLMTKPAYMAVFMYYVLTSHNPASLLFYITADIYSHAQGSVKDMKKWAYEIHSTFIMQMAPLKVPNIDDRIIQEIDGNLIRMDKEDQLRGIFKNAQSMAELEVEKLLEDCREKKEKGLVFASADVKDHMDKSEEMKVVEKCLIQYLEKIGVSADSDDKQMCQAWAIATFLRHIGINKAPHSNILERVLSFVAKDKRGSKFQFGSSRLKTKNSKGHQFSLHHLTKTETCLHCNKVLWGIGCQGYQCSTCEQYVHRNCIEDLKDSCDKDKKKRRVTTLISFNKPRSFSAPLNTNNSEKELITSPTNPYSPNLTTRPLKDFEENELTGSATDAHSVINLVNRFETKVPEDNESGRKGIDLGRSESMRGRVDQRDKPARRSHSDLLLDPQAQKELREVSQGSSSNSSLLKDSSSQSSDTLSAQILDDSDFDVEPELPTLKQVLGDEIYKKLKPKENKRQDVINELFYTEKNHVRALKILHKLFYRPMLKESAITQDFAKMLFPNLEALITLHESLNNSMKSRRKEKSVITEVGDLLLDRFDGEAGENFRNGCALFCQNQSHALETLKIKIRKDPKLAQLLADSENNPLCRRLTLKDIIPKQFMRLTKYPLLIASLLKYTPINTPEFTNLEHALTCSRHILEYVNQAVKDCENHQRLNDLQRQIDKKAIDPENEELRTFDLTKHKLIHDGELIWNINNKKQIELHVVLLERAMVLLQKQDDRLVLKLQNTQLVAGKTDTKKHSPLLWLTNVLARYDATDKKAFFVVNTSQTGPQIYKLQAATAEEQRIWTKFITQASEAMKKNDINSKKKLGEQQVQAAITAQGIWEGQQVLENTPIVSPDDGTYNNSVISTAVQVISPFEKLRQNEKNLAVLMEERQNLLAEILCDDMSMLHYKVQEMTNQDTSEPQVLISACQAQSLQIIEMVKDTTAACMQSKIDSSGEHVDSTEELTLPIPMERLRDMANHMNQILINLLTVVNSQDEERDKLRIELKFAQEELNRLRQIQMKQMEASRDKQQETDENNLQPHLSTDTDASTVAEGDEDIEDIGETPNIVLNEDDMPGLPIDPDIMTESVTLNEVLPGETDTLNEMETSVEIGDIPGTEVDNVGIEATEGEITSDLTEVEQCNEEALQENDPPEEDLMEYIEDIAVDVHQQKYNRDNEDDDDNYDEAQDASSDKNDNRAQRDDQDITEQNSSNNVTNKGDASRFNDVIQESKNNHITARLNVTEGDTNIANSLTGDSHKCLIDSTLNYHSTETNSELMQQDRSIKVDPGGVAVVEMDKKDIIETNISVSADVLTNVFHENNEVKQLEKDINSQLNDDVGKEVTENSPSEINVDASIRDSK